MIMYLASNSRTDIDFAVHQCECFTYAPRQSYAKAVKHIICHIKGTEYKSLFI